MDIPAPRRLPPTAAADHSPQPDGTWLTRIRTSDARTASLTSSGLEDAYDGACAWVNEHVSPRAGITHLREGQPSEILDVIACERQQRPAVMPGATVLSTTVFRLSQPVP